MTKPIFIVHSFFKTMNAIKRNSLAGFVITINYYLYHMQPNIRQRLVKLFIPTIRICNKYTYMYLYQIRLQKYNEKTKKYVS